MLPPSGLEGSHKSAGVLVRARSEANISGSKQSSEYAGIPTTPIVNLPSLPHTSCQRFKVSCKRADSPLPVTALALGVPVVWVGESARL